jgi:hypothetical protein
MFHLWRKYILPFAQHSEKKNSSSATGRPLYTTNEESAISFLFPASSYTQFESEVNNAYLLIANNEADLQLQYCTHMQIFFNKSRETIPL